MTKYTLHGVDGNAFAIMAYVRTAMKEEGFSLEERDKYFEEATSDNYGHLIHVSEKWVGRCNAKATHATKNPLKTYLVTIPIHGSAQIEVSERSAKTAIEEAERIVSDMTPTEVISEFEPMIIRGDIQVEIV